MKTTNLLNEVEFNKLSLNEKRMAIAKDVIVRINNSNFFEERGQILQGDVMRYCDIDPKDAINTKECDVCARGALLCSWIGNFNNVKWNDLLNLNSSTSRPDATYSSTAFPSQLLEVFDQVMLDNIEAAFECCTFDWHYDTIETQKYADAFEREDEDEDIVGAPIIELMEWIIEHKGEFPLP